MSFGSGNRTRISFTLTDGGDYDSDGYNVMLSASADRRTQLAATSRKFARTGEIFFSKGGQRYRFLAASGFSIPANVLDSPDNGYASLNPYLAANGRYPLAVWNYDISR